MSNTTVVNNADDWRDPTSHCYCVVCLAPVRADIFEERGGTCPSHNFDDPITYDFAPNKEIDDL